MIPARPLARASRLVVRIASVATLWGERARTRRQLMSHDDRMLKDIGVGRAEAIGEWRKPFWRT